MSHYVLDARTATPHFPGIGRYVTNLAQALVPQISSGDRLTVLYDPAHPLSLSPSSCLTLVPTAVSPFSLKQQWQIPALLKRLGTDLYHSSYYLMPYQLSQPTLLTLYDIIPILFPAYSTARARLLFRWTTALALRTADPCLTISQATRRDFLHHFQVKAEKITAIPLAADSQFHPYPETQVNGLRQRYHLPERFVLYLGSNKPHKNLVRLVQAWGQLIHQHKLEVPLVIAGRWIPEHPEARQCADALALDAAHIRWLGPVPETDLASLYAAATLFVFPSLYEGFGLPVLEAMSCGTPVACSATSSLPEVGGDAVVYFDPLDCDAIAVALWDLLETEPKLDALQALGSARARSFSWAATASKTLKVWQQVLGNL